MSDDLVKRLRGWAKDIQQGSTAVWAMDQDLKEAAAHIEQLERELSISRMAQVVMDNSVAEVEALTEDNARLRAAIETISYYNTVGYTDLALDDGTTARLGESQ